MEIMTKIRMIILLLGLIVGITYSLKIGTFLCAVSIFLPQESDFKH